MNGVKDKELLGLYKEVLLDWENNPNRHFWINDKILQFHLKQNRIMLTPKTGKEPILDDDFSPKHLGGYLTFRADSKYGQVTWILRHLRNSVAHGKFHKTKIRGRWYVVFKDYDRSEKLTMVGKLPHHC